MTTKKAWVNAYLCREALGKPIIPDKYTHAMRRRNHYLRDYLLRNFLGFTTIRKQLTLFFSIKMLCRQTIMTVGGDGRMNHPCKND